MLQIVEQTKEEKMTMYMKLSKKKIAEMLIDCNDIIAALTQAKNCVIPADIDKLICDSCKCHPNTIYTTSKGRFCERCKPGFY
jgi:hypothetical protein